MAYNFVSASSQYLSTTSTPITTAPLTLAAFGKTSNVTADQTMISIVRATNQVGTYVIWAAGNVVNDPLQAVTWGSIGYREARTTSSYSTSNWFHGAGTYPSGDNSRTAYLDGGSAGTNSVSSGAPTSLAQIWIGAYRVNVATPQNHFDGDLSELAIWSADLTADEIVSLAKGFKPTRIRPQSLVFYAPLIRDLQDTRGGRALTNNNTATVTDHPRVY